MIGSARDGVGRPLLAAGATMALCFGGMAGWIAQAPMASAVLAQGQIAVEGERKTVQHLEGGIVAEINVADGDTVAAGEVVIRLDTAEAQATRAALVAERDAMAARSVRLRAELAGAVPDFVALASADPEGLASAIAGQAALFEARAEERAAERGMLDGTLDRLAARSDAIRAELDAVSAQVALSEQDAAATRTLGERGIVSRAAIRETERGMAGLIGTRASLVAQIAEAEAAEAETRLRRAEMDTEFVSAVSEELATVTARLAETAPALEAAEQRIARAGLRAPVAGTVVGLNVATVGGVIAPGDPLMDIVPASAVLVASARLLPADRERLSEGMAGEIRLPGLEGRGASSLEGTVSRISADRILEPRGEGDDGHYRLTVALQDAPGMDLAPGMPVTIVVPIAPRTVIDYILSPLQDAIARSLREV